MTIFKWYKQKSGQVVIISTVLVGGAIIAATAIAGFTLFFEIRQLNDAVQSSTAIYAADAGIEDSLYCYYFQIISEGQTPEVDCARSGTLRRIDSNGAWSAGYAGYEAQIKCYADEARTSPIPCDARDPITDVSLANGFTVDANGHTQHITRALQTFIYTQ
jgi:hypothetical protein